MALPEALAARLAALPAVVPYERSFDRRYGVEIGEVGPGLATGSLRVRAELLGPAGAVHTGVYAALAESLASLGTAAAVAEDRAVAGLSNATTVVTAVAEGVLHARARCREPGGEEWVWEVAIEAGGRAAAIATVVIAVRPPR